MFPTDNLWQRLAKILENELTEIWSLLGLLDRIAGRSDEAIINFSIEKSRTYAWNAAESLAPLSEADQASKIEHLDEDVAVLGRMILCPGITIGTVTKMIRLGERGTISQIIDILR